MTNTYPKNAPEWLKNLLCQEAAACKLSHLVGSADERRGHKGGRGGQEGPRTCQLLKVSPEIEETVKKLSD